MQFNFKFITTTSFIYGILAFAFSLIGLLLPSSVTYVVGNPILHSSFSFEHILGHIVWGIAVGIVSFRLKYFVIASIFPLILDSDHLLQFLDIEILPRMAHSLLFGVLAATTMTVVFRRIDVLLIMISISSVFAHMSFDIFRADSTGFPLFTPFSNTIFSFNNHDWIAFEIIAISLVVIGTLITQRQKINNMILNKDG